MSLDNEAVRLAYLSKSNQRAMNQQLNTPMSHALSGRHYGRGKAKKEAMEELHSAMGDMSAKEEKAMKKLHSTIGMGMNRVVGGQKGKAKKANVAFAVPIDDEEKPKKMVGGKKAMKKKAEDIGEEYGREMADQDGELKELVGGGFWKDFAKGLKKGVQIAAPFAGPAGAAVSAGLSLIGDGQARGKAEKRRMGVDAQGADMGVKKGGRRAKAGAGDKRKQRGAMISKLMREKGMSLGEASRHIKQNNLI